MPNVPRCGPCRTWEPTRPSRQEQRFLEHFLRQSVVPIAFQDLAEQRVDGREQHPFRLGWAGQGDGFVAAQVGVQFRVGRIAQPELRLPQGKASSSDCRVASCSKNVRAAPSGSISATLSNSARANGRLPGRSSSAFGDSGSGFPTPTRRRPHPTHPVARPRLPSETFELGPPRQGQWRVLRSLTAVALGRTCVPRQRRRGLTNPTAAGLRNDGDGDVAGTRLGHCRASRCSYGKDVGTSG